MKRKTTEIHELRLLSMNDVMRIFGRTERCMRYWMAAGTLRPIRIGRSVFFHPDHIKELLGEQPRRP
jgi:predicted DNA-binding transcriptional regulator AlpA